MVELQRNLETLTRNGIRAFAISPDSPETLRKFAQKYEITYPLLSDEGSRVIRAFGILNTNIPEDHEWFGVPYPGVYAVGQDGRVFDKSFIANHRLRESVNDLLSEVVYPEPEMMELEVLGESLPIYTGRLAIRARCLGGSKDGVEKIQVTARLRYQACDDRECFPPEALTFVLSLHFLPHDWELIT